MISQSSVLLSTCKKYALKSAAEVLPGHFRQHPTLTYMNSQLSYYTFIRDRPKNKTQWLPKKGRKLTVFVVRLCCMISMLHWSMWLYHFPFIWRTAGNLTEKHLSQNWVLSIPNLPSEQVQKALWFLNIWAAPRVYLLLPPFLSLTTFQSPSPGLQHSKQLEEVSRYQKLNVKSS